MNVLWDMRNAKQSSKVWVGILVFILYLILEYTYMSLFLKNIKKVNNLINCTFFYVKSTQSWETCSDTYISYIIIQKR